VAGRGLEMEGAGDSAGCKGGGWGNDWMEVLNL